MAVQRLFAALLCVFTPIIVSVGADASVIFDHEFAGSSTGTSVVSVGDTISFEAFITIEEFTELSNVAVSFTGDIETALATERPCPLGPPDDCFVGTAHNVTQWLYADTSASRYDSVGVRRREGPRFESWVDSGGNPGLALGSPVFQGFMALMGNIPQGSFYEGTGKRSLMGTVTITANQAGSFDAGVLVYPGVTGVYNFVGGSEVVEIPSMVNPGEFGVIGFTVLPVPEPGTALLVSFGLLGIALRTRRSS